MATRLREPGAADDPTYLCSLDEGERLDVLYRIYRDDIYRLCHRHLRNAADAEDATQEIMLKVAAKLPQYRRELAFRPWLRTISRNVCRDFQRSETRIIRLIDRQAEHNGAVSPSTPAPEAESPEEAFRRRQNARLVIEALLSLPETHRKMLYLQVYEGLSYEEIAKRAHRSHDSVRSILTRAKGTLKTYFEELGLTDADWRAPSFVAAGVAVLRRMRARSRSWMLRNAAKGSNVAADNGPLNAAIMARATEAVAAGIVALGALALPHAASTGPAQVATATPAGPVRSAPVEPPAQVSSPHAPAAPGTASPAPVAPNRDADDVTRVRVESPDGSGAAYNASIGEEDRALRFKRGLDGPIPVFGEDYDSGGETTIKCDGHPVGQAACDTYDRLPSGTP
jgi:RNA polymerase sigma factor (sigma-70 family)